MVVFQMFQICYFYNDLRGEEKNSVKKLDPKTKTNDWKITVWTKLGCE